MTKEQLKQYYPDTFAFFCDMPPEHPFWKQIAQVERGAARAGRTLLEDMEQVFAALHLVDGHHVFADRVADVETEEELMQLLTKLYVAYLYRDSGARLVHGAQHGFDIEVRIADQLLALGVVSFHSFESLTDQFAAAVHDEVQHLRQDAHHINEITAELAASGDDVQMPVRAAQDVAIEHATHDQTPAEFLNDLESYSKTLGPHDTAHHSVLTSVTAHSELLKKTQLAQHIAQNPAELAERFPMIAGVLLVDPNPGTEKATFVPFHVGSEYLEQLLDKER